MMDVVLEGEWRPLLDRKLALGGLFLLLFKLIKEHELRFQGKRGFACSVTQSRKHLAGTRFLYRARSKLPYLRYDLACCEYMITIIDI